MNNPTKEHMEAMHQILRYLKMTPRKGLYFKKMSSKDIEIIINVDCAISITDYGLTSKYCTYVYENLVVKQETIYCVNE